MLIRVPKALQRVVGNIIIGKFSRLKKGVIFYVYYDFFQSPRVLH